MSCFWKHHVTRVDVDPPNPTTGVIERVIYFAGKDDPKLPETAWPIWVAKPEGETAVQEFQHGWQAAAEQTRSAAKWIATVLGASLAALAGLAGTAPLTGLRDEGLSTAAKWSGVVGLLLLAVTLSIVLRVLVPEQVTFADLERNTRFSGLRQDIEGDAEYRGLFLPIGIDSLAELRGRARVEELTLNAFAEQLAKLPATTKTDAASDDLATNTQPRSKRPSPGTPEPDDPEPKAVRHLTEAQAGRAAWLASLNLAMGQWTTIAAFTQLRGKAQLASRLGVPLGVAGTALVIGAFLAPAPDTPPTFKRYTLAATAAEPLKNVLGADCRSFKGQVISADDPDLTVLVSKDEKCRVALVTLNKDRDLAPVATPLPTVSSP
jgi:hypothetical protein